MEYKFRGFDIVGHKWVFGDLVRNQKVTRTGLEPRVMVGGYEVDPKSVGMFTGKKDIFGEEVYEKDIVRTTIKGDVSVDAVVVYNTDMCAFLLRCGYGDYCMYGECEKIGIDYEENKQ